ncbi:MAG: hypothetical protein JSV52_12425 [Candidatus Zixiibacteriota bacterium]|nr:MAG: hypothetical protein JSV52_12425 [candidate division Zixibacteria bacterium]
MLTCRKLATLLILTTLVVSVSVQAGEKDPVTGDVYAQFQQLQYPQLQSELDLIVPESGGYLITGPLDVRVSTDDIVDRIYRAIRIVCPDLASVDSVISAIKSTQEISVGSMANHLSTASKKEPVGFRGVLMDITWQDKSFSLLICTTQQIRWLIWFKQFVSGTIPDAGVESLQKYSESVSDYLYQLDLGNLQAEPPVATDFGVPERCDIFATPPDYVIQGYDNYMNYLYAHREIRTDFARGVKAFVPTDSLLDLIINRAPAEAFPNKEAPMLQNEYRKFFGRNGDVRVMETLTAAGFDTLQTGEYFFAVGITGKIRFGRELLRAEVERIEKETGQKVPRANHAFLFPGEPILTAGAFFVERNGSPKIVEITAQSGHYFYSNVSPTIREDISLRSDHYLMTLGHFFKALRSLGIEYGDVLVSKF